MRRIGRDSKNLWRTAKSNKKLVNKSLSSKRKKVSRRRFSPKEAAAGEVVAAVAATA